MKIKKGDNVKILSGKDRGKTGKISKSLPKVGKVIVDGIAMVKKHLKPKRGEDKGQIVNIAKPIDSSNVQIICPSCGKATRIGYKMIEDQKVRICKKCSKEI